MAQKLVSIWRDINLIGRSRLVKKLQGMVHTRKRFVLKGVAGVGKTALTDKRAKAA
jgi:ATP/maltotriose-dependent transcriptional regulator MalT